MEGQGPPMIVFILLVVIGGLVGLGSLLRLPGFNSVRGRMRWGMALLYIGFGVAHIAIPDRFLPIMPPMIPLPKQVVILTGVCEIAGAIGLLQPAFRRWAGIALALYAVCVFPANIYHALAHIDVPGLPDSWWYHGPRLLLQPVFVWWALFSGGAINWPFDDPRPEFAKSGSFLGAAPPEE
jgi:uncharacterized membrane protein